jgi:hypothetical protein
VEARAGYRCEYCHAPQSACGYRFHLEHVLPKSQGGSDGIDNRALSCASCNLGKSSKTEGVDPQTGAAVGLFNPRTDAWTDHFQWSEDQQTVVGLTSTGRATIAELGMNEDLPSRPRPLWFRAGLLP